MPFIFDSPCNDAHQPRDTKVLAPHDSHTVKGTPPPSDKGNFENMATRMCPYGYERAQDTLAASDTGPTGPPLDEASSDSTPQPEEHHDIEVLTWKQYAAEQEKKFIGILNWGLSLIQVMQSLESSLRNVTARFATAQDLVKSLRRDREELERSCASLEERLRNARVDLRTAEDRAMTLERENQQFAIVVASIKRQIEQVDRMIKDERVVRDCCVPSRAETEIERRPAEVQGLY